LSRFTSNEEFKKSTQVPEQTKWLAPVKKSIECQNDPLAPFHDKQTTVSVTYMLEKITNTHENFTLAILCSLLTDGPNAPFYQALIESGLGSDYSPNSGYSNYTKQALFSIGLQGISKNEVNSVINSIDMALKNAVTDGFPNERIEAILHRVELSTKHQSSNFGLGLIMNLNPMWTHDANPIDGLRVNEHVEEFRSQLKRNPNYLKDKIKEHFLLNTHKLVLEMSPSDKYESNLQQKEQQILNQKLSQLNDEMKKEIYENGIELEKIQKTPEDLSVLPTLSVKNDISKQFKTTNIETTKILNVPIQWSAQPTNGITYFNAIMKLNSNNFPKHLVPYLPLFSQVMTKLGAEKMDRKKLDQEIQLRTGGLQTSVHVSDHTSQFDLFERGLIISSYCLERNIEHMFKLWTDIFTGIRFDDDYEHLQQLIKMCSAELAMSVPQHGHRYAISRSASSLGGAFKFRELTSGLSSLSHFRQMAAMENIQQIVDHLKSIGSILLKTDGLRCSINGEAPTIRPSLQIIERFIQSIGNNSVANSSIADSPSDVLIPAVESTLSEHHVFPFANNYLGKSIFCVPFTHNDFAKLKIASKLVSSKYLHREIREKGGAYGGGALFTNGGVFNYFSYRDPHINQTINAFKGSVEWLLDQKNYSEQDIDEAKLATFQEVDHPIMPSEQGLQFFVNGISDQMKHEYRMRLLDVTKSDIEEVAKRYD
jgi:Zn-dependent M16 (insulinase) family peptidase